MSQFGHFFSGRPDIQPPISHTTPFDIQRPISHITPNQGEIGGGSFTTPIQPNIGGSFTTPIQPYEGGILSLFGNPDYAGQDGFPEEPTGFGGLGPIGPLGGTPEGEEPEGEEVDPFYKSKIKWIADESGLSHDDDIKNFIADIGGSNTPEGVDKIIQKYYQGGLDKFYQDLNNGKI